ncbi:DUF3168 domain-containing protein [Acinetobacter sp. 194]|uniref:DUF3168 domain-containing protein n=1 Tax=Acinetobacter shaoyimingii TaxID=2715164 RepID=UPI00140BBB51|nr:DUF3168 domain-containing protein [Acinetobacter shaoyimingii]NHB57025.1 DUF3168 domain-containing protein [Acinetobacter shaoyimingii]
MNQLPIYKLLKANSRIVNMLSDRIYEDVAPEKTQTPYLVWSEVSGIPNTSVDNITNEDDVDYQVTIYSPNQKTASNIRTAVADILQKHSLIDQRFGNYESDTRLFARGFSGSWWVNR